MGQFVFRAGAVDHEVTPLNYFPVQFHVASFDPEGVFDLDADRFVAPVRGYYQFDGSVEISEITPGTRVAFQLIVNGTTARYNLGRVAHSSVPADGTLYREALNGGVVLRLQAGDYVEMTVNHDDPSNVRIESGTFLAGYLLRSY